MTPQRIDLARLYYASLHLLARTELLRRMLVVQLEAEALDIRARRCGLIHREAVSEGLRELMASVADVIRSQAADIEAHLAPPALYCDPASPGGDRATNATARNVGGVWVIVDIEHV